MSRKAETPQWLMAALVAFFECALVVVERRSDCGHQSFRATHAPF